MMSINNRRWWTSSLHGVNQFIDKPIVVPCKEMSLLDVDRTGAKTLFITLVMLHVFR